MKMNNTIGLTLIALLTLGAGTALATSTEATEMMKTKTMDTGMKTETMEEMDEMKTDAMEKMDEMNTDAMEKMDGEMNKDHKKKDMMES
jgi:hypothetical protein